MSNDKCCIRMSECVDRHVYRLRSRNLVLGVYRAATGGFIGLRQKFDETFLFEEYHEERDRRVGTAHPLEDVGILPYDIVCGTSDPALGSWLDGNPALESWLAEKERALGLL
jgi:hypothetical protein